MNGTTVLGSVRRTDANQYKNKSRAIERRTVQCRCKLRYR